MYEDMAEYTKWLIIKNETLQAEVDRRRKQEQEDLLLLQEAAEMIGNYGTSTYQDIIIRLDEAKAEGVP